MRFEQTTLDGVIVIDLEVHADDRGFFARTFCIDEMRQHGIEMQIVQSSLSFNRRAGTLRGIHYQRAPYAESKLVRCTMGAIYDVVVDLRPTSPTHRQWVAAELTEENRRAIYIPEGCAHGFLTLVDNCEVHYQMSAPYHPAAGAGVRWNDPAFGITWPSEPVVTAERDAHYPDYDEQVGT
jgi:dTDP-4-dehydrorhamnose 3,5-epimerase